MMAKKESKKNNSGIKEFVAAQIGTKFSKNAINASNEAIEGMDLLRKACQNKINVNIEFKQGNFFEYIEMTKFNIDAAKRGESIRAIVTESIGLPHSKADILIKENGKILQEVQAKSSKKASYATNMLTNSKYNGMQKLTNSDKCDEVKERARQRIIKGTLKENEFRDTYNNVTGELKYDKISSGGTSYDEAIEAAKNPQDYIKNLELREFTNEIKTSAINTAIIGGAVSLLKNGINIYNDKQTLNEAIKEITKDTFKSGVRGGATGGIAACIRIGAKKLGNGKVDTLLSSSTYAVTLASAMLDVGVAVYSYANGDINENELKDKMAEVGVKTISTVYISQAAQVALGVAPGSFVPIAAYTLSYYIYTSCKAVLENARLKEEESKKIVDLYNESIISLQEQRFIMENAIQEKLNTNQKMFNNLVKALDIGIEKNNLDSCIEILQEFSMNYGKQLKLANFEDFEDFMLSNNSLNL